MLKYRSISVNTYLALNSTSLPDVDHFELYVNIIYNTECMTSNTPSEEISDI